MKEKRQREKRYRDVAELEKVSGISAAKIRKMLRLGELQGTKLGNKWYITNDVFNEFLGLDKQDVDLKTQMRITELESKLKECMWIIKNFHNAALSVVNSASDVL